MSRLKPQKRRDQIVDAVIDMISHGARVDGLTAHGIAKQAGCAPTLVTHYFGGLSALIDSVVVEGVARRVPAVIVAGLARRHPDALALSDADREHAARSV